jgi:uncharacterized protein YycO
MAKVKLRFTKNSSVVSKLIRLFTWSEFSHVEFVLNEGLLGAQVDGVKIRPFDYAKCEYVYRYVDCTIPQYNLVIDYATKQIGKPYDFTGIINLALHRNWREKDSWFCSELVAASFEAAGIYLIRDDVTRITPQMLLECEEVHE